MPGKGFPSNATGSDANLSKPTRQSIFEKQKAEAEAKRKRDAAETAAVYEDFVKSFDRDDDDDDDFRNRRDRDDYNNGGRREGGGGFPTRGGSARGAFGSVVGSGGSRRHFGAPSSSLKSGPGSLGPAPTGFGKKRPFQDFAKGSSGIDQREKVGAGFDDRSGHGQQQQQQPSASLSKAFATSDDEDMGEAHDDEQEKAVARPTLRLSNVPPGTSPATIKAMMPSNLVVENVKLLPWSPPVGTDITERKNLVVIVTMSPETPATDMDAAVSAMQNRYMGYGYYLALHRHLSSAVASSAALPNMGSSNAAHPFGAKRVDQVGPERKDVRQQKGFHRRFAPPTSYGPNYVAPYRVNIFHVPVKPPQDIRTIQLINMVIEGILEHGPEFEALLMSRRQVQMEEKWAWLWDARSEGGIWLRWKLWEVVTGSQPKAERGKYVPLFEGADAWKSPEKALPFEYTTKLDEFVSDSEYNSSDEEDWEDEANNNHNHHRGGEEEEGGKTFLNPLEKAKLTHLLARLPTTITKLRKGDVARITAFAIMHASRGVDEVVDMMVSNIERPFSLAVANPERQRQGEGEREKSAATGNDEGGALDTSGASLIGLYVVNDVLSSSSTSGVRHAWRYRQLIEAALRDRKTFASLGSMAERQGWGRLRAEKWKRSIGLVLNLWEGWCVFPADSQALFAETFEKPPSAKAEEKVEESEGVDGRWKLVESSRVEPPTGTRDDGQDGGEAVKVDTAMEDADVEGEPIGEEDVEGEPIGEEDVEGEPIGEEDVEGEPIEEDDIEGEAMDEDGVMAGESIEEEEVAGERMDEDKKEVVEDDKAVIAASEAGPGPGLGPRRRMRAADMFADSDGSE